MKVDLQLQLFNSRILFHVDKKKRECLKLVYEALKRAEQVGKQTDSESVKAKKKAIVDDLTTKLNALSSALNDNI